MDTTTQLDPQAKNLAIAIRQTETGGDFNAQGKSGEWGAYQFTQPTWQKLNQKYGTNYQFTQATPEQQNELAYKQIKEWKDAGYNVGQVASMWNAGEDKPNAYLEGNKGVNKYGVKYDTAQYANSIATAYQTLKTGGQAGMDTNNPSSISGTQVQQPQAPYGASFPAPELTSQDNPLAMTGRVLGNIPSSALNLGKNIAGTILHPIKTVENLARIPLGAGEELGSAITGNPTNDANTQAFHGLIDFFKNRYGSVNNFRKTIENDPVGFGLDLSLALKGSGAALEGIGKAGQASEIADLTEGLSGADKTSAIANAVNEGALGKVAQSGQALSGIGSEINPLRLAGEGIKSAAKVAGRAVSGPLGVALGTQGQALRDFYNSIVQGGESQEAATEGLRGNITPDELVGKARDAFGEVIDNRNATYQEMLSGLENSDAEVDTTPIMDEFNNQLEKFKIKVNPENGSLDFRNSALRFDTSAQTTINRIADEVEKIITGEADTTPIGIDTLKKSFGYLDNPTGGARAFTTPMYQATSDTLSGVPGYTDAMDKYSEATQSLDEMRKALSLGDKAAVETTYKKLISGLRQNNEFRSQALRELDMATDNTLVPSIAGQQLSSFMPRGLAKYGDIFGIAEAAFHGVGIVPILGMLMATSPRLVGEVLRAVGIIGNKVAPVMNVLDRFVPEAMGGANVASNIQSQNPPISAFSLPIMVNTKQNEDQAIQEVSQESNKPSILIDEKNLTVTLPSGKVYKFPDLVSLHNFKREVGL